MSFFLPNKEIAVIYADICFQDVPSLITVAPFILHTKTAKFLSKYSHPFCWFQNIDVDLRFGRPSLFTFMSLYFDFADD